MAKQQQQTSWVHASADWKLLRGADVIAGVMEHTHDVIAPWRCESIM